MAQRHHRFSFIGLAAEHSVIRVGEAGIFALSVQNGNPITPIPNRTQGPPEWIGTVQRTLHKRPR